MASIGQGVVGEAHCISLVEVAAEQMLEPIDIVPAHQRLGLVVCWCCLLLMLAI